MARWLASLGLCCGLAVVGTGGFAPAQKPPASGSAQRSEQSQAGGGSRGDRSRDDRSRDDRSHDDDRRGDGHRPPPPPPPPRMGDASWWNALAWRRVAEFVRRNGEPLELLPLLLVPQARAEMGLNEAEFKPKIDAYLAEVQKRMDEERKRFQPGRDFDHAKQFSDSMAKENEEFQRFFSQLSPAQQDRLIGLFVQARGYRAISNRLVSAKVGMSEDEAAVIREKVDSIREDVMEQSKDRFRRVFDKGGDPKDFEKLIRENQKKIDARIEDELTEQQREELTALRGKDVAEPRDWLLRGVEMPRPPLPPRNGGRTGPKPPPKPDCCSN